MTTHYMEEAENCDRIAVIDHGKIQALDTPDALKRLVGGDKVVVTGDPALQRDIAARYGVAVQQVGTAEFHFQVAHGAEFVPRVAVDFRRPHPVDPGQAAEPRRRLLEVDRADHPRGGGDPPRPDAAGPQDVDGEALNRASLHVIYTIWLREFKAFLRDGPVLGMIGQPLLYLLILGQGIANGMTINRAPGVNYLQFMFPGILGMSVLFTSMFSAISIIWDREFGFLKEVLVAPVPRWAVAVGKVLGGATIAVFQSMILVVVSPFAGIYPSPLMVLELMLLCFLISVAMTSLGTAIAARMRSMQGFQMIMNFLVMPLYFLSGAMFPYPRRRPGCRRSWSSTR